MNFLKTLFLAFIGFVFSCGLCEVAIRITKLAPDISPIVVNKPWGDFETHQYKSINYLPRIGSKDINSSGLRDREFNLNKTRNTFRVLVIGDSVVYGLCYRPNHLPLGHRVTEKLEKLLDLQAKVKGIDTKFEVYNFGVSGFNAEQEVDLLELKGLQFKPDLVIQVYCLNDDTEMSAEIDTLKNESQSVNKKWNKIKKFQESKLGQYLLWSHFYRLIYQRMNALSDSKEEQAQIVEDERLGTIVIRAYDKLKTLSEMYGFKVMIVNQPLIVDALKYQEEWEHQRTEKMANERGFDYIDILPAYREKFGSILDPISCGDILHPNELGHQMLADAIFNKLKGSQIFLPEDSE